MRLRFIAFLLLMGLALPTLGQEASIVGAEMAEMFDFAAPRIKLPQSAHPAPAPEVRPTGGRELMVSAYAYCLRGVTASGRYTRHGIIAVDPRVIPLGSKLYVPGYGWGIAADTGGAIIGHKIDLWMPTSSQCYQWGVRRVRIKVFPRK